jgi:hypothetical protein
MTSATYIPIVDEFADDGQESRSCLRLGDRFWFVGGDNDWSEPSTTSVYEESIQNELAGAIDDMDIGRELRIETLAMQFRAHILEFVKEPFDGTRESEFAEYVHRSIAHRGDIAIAAWRRAARRSELSERKPAPTASEIDAWFSGLDQDAEENGNLMPPMALIEEAKRIVGGLERDLLEECDVYTLEKGEVAIEVFGEHGYAFLLICELDGRALCIIAEPNRSRRARYESSESLPDNFLRDGLIAVRHAHRRPQLG